MKYLVLIVSLCFISNLSAQTSLNMSLLGQVDRGDNSYSGSWIYVDTDTGKEYALLGSTSGTAVYDISTNAIEEVGFISGPFSRWREITVIGQYAYVVTEGRGNGEGMQVLDLRNLPNELTLLTTYNRTFSTGHIIQRDIYTEAPFVYVNGICSSCGVNIIDVSNPERPEEIGNYNPGYYVHDSHVKGDYLYAAAFFNGTIDIVDISDKSNPFLVNQIEVPGGNVHSAWLTEDDQHLIISPERDGLPARIWNIADLENLFEVSTYSGNLQSLTHNPYIRGDFSFFSHNTEGIRVVDIKDPSCPVEVGFYDTFPGQSGGFNGLWSACPYSASGKIIGGNREDGLYVWTFNNTAANRINIRINDATTNLAIETATIQLQDGMMIQADRSGVFKYGTLASEIAIRVEADGFQSMDTTLLLVAGTQMTIELFLQPRSVSTSEIHQLPVAFVYPNPFSTTTSIDLSPFVNDAQTLVLTDVLGRALQTFPVKKRTTFQLEKGGLENGLYYYLIYNQQGQPLAKGTVILEE